MSYTAKDIETLDFRSAIRKRVEMYMGSADNQGVLQCAREIISNSIDEAIMGYGKTITIEYFGNNRLRVTDEGRGCPFGVRDDGTEALEAIYMTAHSGGKFSDKTYQSVIGANGIGGKGVALSSDECVVISKRDGLQATLKIKDGFKESFNIEEISPDEHGTTVEYVPSQEVYRLEPIQTDFEAIKNMCRNWAYLNRGIAFHLINHETREDVTFISHGGLVDLIRDQAKDAIHATPASFTIVDGDTTCEVALQWTKGKEKSFTFTNGLYQPEGGTSLTGMKTAITRFMKGKIGSDFNGDTARMGLVYVVACKTPRPSFANQIKSKINNPELNGLAQRATTQALTDFCKEHPDEFKLIEDILQRQRKAEQAAERARNAVLRATKDIEKNIRAKVFSSDKLKDAKKLGKDSVLLICEGKSAVNALALGRDPNKYGLLEIRGKIINCLTNPLEKVMENEEVKLIFSALGVTPNNYKAGKLRYGKVGIATDADKDGNHIALLLLSFFSEMLPDMLKEGRIMRLLSPTHLVKAAGQEFFFYSDEEFRKRTVRGETVLVKGLGELTAGQIKTSMFGSKQHLVPFNWTPEDDALLRNFMGDDIEFRKDYLFNHCDFSQITE